MLRANWPSVGWCCRSQYATVETSQQELGFCPIQFCCWALQKGWTLCPSQRVTGSQAALGFIEQKCTQPTPTERKICHRLKACFNQEMILRFKLQFIIECYQKINNGQCRIVMQRTNDIFNEIRLTILAIHIGLLFCTKWICLSVIHVSFV